ncbi:PKD domain-containing protein [Aquimarina sp. MMG016]|uniref:PKD domain-containing protein n=1 Tax=Aquimarina sp. MMG016 TaxID=2822690 RepID=UPI001B3A7164|nr:PKD domain-containing protein [Aquimarina sp. MMG016]MBQ4821286.1 PKD domain-containing protein [Aquimarina sp. MMG016]
MKGSDNMKNYHIDRSVVLFFVITLLISATVFGFRYANYTPCEIIEFDINARNYRVGEIIRFKDNTKGAITREWHFGDSSKADARVAPFHTYEKPGEYEVNLVINGKCNSTRIVTIKEKVFILDSTKLAKFDVPKSVKVGEVLKLKDKTLNARSWEWRFGETAEINSKKKNPVYIYNEPGLKTITLVVNGDVRYKTQKKITVLAKEKKKEKVVRPIIRPKESKSGLKLKPSIGVEENKPKEFKAPFISKKAFEAKLLEVYKKTATANDFSPYLCGNLDLSVLANKKRTTFLELCERIKRKGAKVKELEIVRAENNCIKNIVIRYSKLKL